MNRAMSISINEDEHPCWEQVDKIWEEYGLSKDQDLSTEQAKEYVKKYAVDELGFTAKALVSEKKILRDIFADIDTNSTGQFSRDDMFAHLKRVREMEFDRESDSGSSNTSPIAPVAIPGFSKVDELQDDKERLIQEISTPLTLPQSPRSASKTQKQLKLLPMQPIEEKKEIPNATPETEVPKPE